MTTEPLPAETLYLCDYNHCNTTWVGQTIGITPSNCPVCGEQVEPYHYEEVEQQTNEDSYTE